MSAVSLLKSRLVEWRLSETSPQVDRAGIAGRPGLRIECLPRNTAAHRLSLRFRKWREDDLRRNPGCTQFRHAGNETVADLLKRPFGGRAEIRKLDHDVARHVQLEAGRLRLHPGHFQLRDRSGREQGRVEAGFIEYRLVEVVARDRKEEPVEPTDVIPADGEEDPVVAAALQPRQQRLLLLLLLRARDPELEISDAEHAIGDVDAIEGGA